MVKLVENFAMVNLVKDFAAVKLVIEFVTVKLVEKLAKVVKLAIIEYSQAELLWGQLASFSITIGLLMRLVITSYSFLVLFYCL